MPEQRNDRDPAAEVLGRLMHARPRAKLTLPPQEQRRIHRRSGYDLIAALEREGYVVLGNRVACQHPDHNHCCLLSADRCAKSDRR